MQDVVAVAGDDATAQQLAAEGAGGRQLARYVPSATASWRLNLLRSGDVPDSLLASIRCRWRDRHARCSSPSLHHRICPVWIYIVHILYVSNSSNTYEEICRAIKSQSCKQVIEHSNFIQWHLKQGSEQLEKERMKILSFKSSERLQQQDALNSCKSNLQ